jgi:hypothetical protein
LASDYKEPTVAICAKHGISEMECDCPQWSAEAQDILGRRQGATSNIPTEVWRRMIMDPVEREARMLAKVRDGKEDNWQAHAWDAYQSVLQKSHDR